MKKLSPKICQTASGVLIVAGRVLLIKHKKMGCWMTPGGHLDEGEFLYQAAEREFWEETGLKVKAIDPFAKLWEVDEATKEKYYQPAPIAVNIHWVCRENYAARCRGENKVDPVWKKGCEQHLDFKYLVEATDGLDFKQNVEETDGIAWFSLEQVRAMSKEEIFDNVRSEIILAFKLI